MAVFVSENAKQIKRVLARHEEGEAGALVNVLHELQSEFRYLPEEALRLTAEHLGVSEAHVFGVATFYEGFHLQPRGEHICTVCMGTACHVRGAPKLLDRLERDFGTLAGGTTADMKVTLETVNCVGACALGPLVIVDGEYNGNMTTARVEKLAKKIKEAD
jgi:NADH-quinone oxidoreductase subunit E